MLFDMRIHSTPVYKPVYGALTSIDCFLVGGKRDLDMVDLNYILRGTPTKPYKLFALQTCLLYN